MQLYIISSAYRLRLIPIYAAANSAAVKPSSDSESILYPVISLLSGTKVADPRLLPANLVVLGEVSALISRGFNLCLRTDSIPFLLIPSWIDGKFEWSLFEIESVFSDLLVLC